MPGDSAEVINNVLVFDIETVPDVAGGRRLYDLADLDDAGVAKVMFNQRYQDSQGRTDFLRHHLQRIVAISVVMRRADTFNVWSLGTPQSSEKELIQRFFDGIERYTPNLVSWNGGGFDLPVIHYRALLHGLNARRYWETGNEDQSFRWNNYLNRFHERHTDLMDVLAGYDARAFAPLDEIAALLGLPGKQGMSGAAVWDQLQAGNIDAIRAYCESDVLNTYLIYLRFELMRGRLDQDDYRQEMERTREFLRQQEKEHFGAFLRAWEQASAVLS